MESGKEPITKDRLVLYVNANDWVTLAEINQKFSGTEGELAWFSSVDENIIFWANASEALLEAVRDARTSGEIEVVQAPSGILPYVIDGSCLALPIAKSLPKGGYKKPHWLPICLRPSKAVKKGKKR